MADSELQMRLARRQQLMEEAERREQQQQRQVDEVKNGETGSTASEEAPAGSDDPEDSSEQQQETNPKASNPFLQMPRCQGARAPDLYAEFKEFSRRQIKQYKELFLKYDKNRDGFIDIEELKRMMEILGAPQTHLALKQMIREVDEDHDDMISVREFIVIFRKAAAGELVSDSGLMVLAQLTAIDVAKEGVIGAKNFFEAKIDELNRLSSFEAEIKEEQEIRRKESQEKKQRQQEFKSKQAVFNKA